MPGSIVVFHRFRPTAFPPEKMTALSSGWDLKACIEDSNTQLIIPPGEVMVINTGLNVSLAPGWELQIRSRSGLAAKRKVHVLNSPGTIDSDYLGNGPDFEIKVILHNANLLLPFPICHGLRIAQAVLSPVYEATWVEAEEPLVGGGERIGGLGSTGT